MENGVSDNDEHMPDDPDSEDYTPPFRQSSVDIRRVDRSAPVRRLERELPPGDFAIASRVYQAIKADNDSANEDLQTMVGEAIRAQAQALHQLSTQASKHSMAIHDLKNTGRFASRIAWAAPAIALAIASYVAHQIWTGAEELTTIRMKMEYQLETIRRLERMVESKP